MSIARPAVFLVQRAQKTAAQQIHVVVRSLAAPAAINIAVLAAGLNIEQTPVDVVQKFLKEMPTVFAVRLLIAAVVEVAKCNTALKKK